MKFFIPTVFILALAVLSFTFNDNKKIKALEAENQMLKKALQKDKKIGAVQVVRLKSALPDEEVQRIFKERAPQFKELNGLVQKYYLKDRTTGHYCGIYLWESPIAYLSYRQTELAKTIGDAYQVEEQPRVEIYEMIFPLRD